MIQMTRDSWCEIPPAPPALPWRDIAPTPMLTWPSEQVHDAFLSSNAWQGEQPLVNAYVQGQAFSLLKLNPAAISCCRSTEIVPFVVELNHYYQLENGADMFSPLADDVGGPMCCRFAGGGAGSSSSDSVRSITSATGRLLPDLGIEELSREPVSGVAILCMDLFGVARCLPPLAKLTTKASSSSSM